jgi:hypothetical protein
MTFNYYSIQNMMESMDAAHPPPLPHGTFHGSSFCHCPWATRDDGDPGCQLPFRAGMKNESRQAGKRSAGRGGEVKKVSEKKESKRSMACADGMATRSWPGCRADDGYRKWSSRCRWAPQLSLRNTPLHRLPIQCIGSQLDTIGNCAVYWINSSACSSLSVGTWKAEEFGPSL